MKKRKIVYSTNMSGKSLSFAQVSDWSSGLEEIQMAASSESLKIKKHLSPSFLTQTAFFDIWCASSNGPFMQ